MKLEAYHHRGEGIFLACGQPKFAPKNHRVPPNLTDCIPGGPSTSGLGEDSHQTTSWGLTMHMVQWLRII